MATRRRQQFIYGQTAWMLSALVVLAALGALSLELFFVVSLLGFLVSVELTTPVQVRPVWRSRLRWLIAVGLVVFGLLTVRRILRIVPEGVF